MLSSFQAKLHEKSHSGPTKAHLSSLFEASNVTRGWESVFKTQSGTGQTRQGYKGNVTSLSNIPGDRHLIELWSPKFPKPWRKTSIPMNSSSIKKEQCDWDELEIDGGETTCGGNGTKWVADFSSQLIFPDRINHFQYSLYTKGETKFTAHAVTNVSNNLVVVETENVVNGVVSLVVHQ
ncbi:hypothetical protein M0R45_014022 [Rubus argutus]|uniref:Uncharacterized protein n=1 Tax=Rubus argutus TaxID=59490 RepID=A0AAW1XLD6_RUBAR